MALPADSTSSTGNSQSKLTSQWAKDDAIMGLPVLTSTPFQPMTSASTTPLSLPEPSAFPLVLPMSDTSTGRSSLSIASPHETSKPIQNQPVASTEKQSPTVHTSRQPITASTINYRSADHILKQFSGLNQASIISRGSRDFSLSTHRSKS